MTMITAEQREVRGPNGEPVMYNAGLGVVVPAKYGRRSSKTKRRELSVDRVSGCPQPRRPALCTHPRARRGPAPANCTQNGAIAHKSATQRSPRARAATITQKSAGEVTGTLGTQAGRNYLVRADGIASYRLKNVGSAYGVRKTENIREMRVLLLRGVQLQTKEIRTGRYDFRIKLSTAADK